MTKFSIPILLGLLFSISACGNDTSSTEANESPKEYDGDNGAGSPGNKSPADENSNGDKTGEASDDEVPPGKEQESSLQVNAPSVGKRYIFAPNAFTNSVAVVDSTDLSVRTIALDADPGELTVFPGTDTVLALKPGAANLSLISASVLDVQQSSVAVPAGSNSVVASPTGANAIVWFDGAKRKPADVLGSFQTVALLKVGPDSLTTIDLTVGFRPRGVIFAQDGKTAFVTTEDGISILDIENIKESMITPSILYPVGPDTAKVTDVSIIASGKYAVARTEESATLLLIDIEAKSITPLTLGASITDVDILPSGKSLLAAHRSTGIITQILIPEGFSDAAMRGQFDISAVAQADTAGSIVVSPDEKLAMVFTTSAATPQMVLLPLDGQSSPRVIQLKKGVDSVGISQSGKYAIVSHQVAKGNPNQPGISIEEQIARSEAYSIVNLETGFAKLSLTTTKIGAITITPDELWAFLLFRDDKESVKQIVRVSLSTFLENTYQMQNPPASIAAVATTKQIVVGQSHTAGRLSFINWETGELLTVSGFELNGGIRE